MNPRIRAAVRGCIVALFIPAVARAQGTVAISGLIDGGIAFVDDIGSHRGDAHAFQAKSGDANVSRLTLSGNEPLGADLNALFLLATGFAVTSGALGQQGRLFGFQSYVGLASGRYGTVTVGRQFDSTLQLVQPFALAGAPFGGVAFAHPFDNDNLANYTRTNNSVKYTSPLLGGFRFGATYGFSNEAGGFGNNRGYAFAATYEHGPFSAGASYLAFDREGNLPPANADGAEPAGAPFNAARQRTVSAAAAYTWDRLRVSAIATRTRLDAVTSINNVADAPIVLHGANITFHNAEINARYALTRKWTVAADYVFTVASFDGAAGAARPRWQQAGVIAIDALSPRTDVYTEALFQHANGLAGTGIAGAQISNFSRASGANQLVMAVGIRHRF